MSFTDNLAHLFLLKKKLKTKIGVFLRIMHLITVLVTFKVGNLKSSPNIKQKEL